MSGKALKDSGQVKALLASEAGRRELRFRIPPGTPTWKEIAAAIGSMPDRTVYAVYRGWRTNPELAEKIKQVIALVGLPRTRPPGKATA